MSHSSENFILGLNSKERAVRAIIIKLTELEIQYLEAPYVTKDIHPLER